jgi:hypothetical protein
MLGSAAIALIEADDVEAAAKRLVGDTQHVVRIARSLEPVQRDDRWVGPWIVLPVTMCEDARSWLHIKEPCRRWWQVRKTAIAGPDNKSHPVAATQPSRWGKI